MKAAKTEGTPDRSHEYASALSSYLSGGGEDALRRAYEVGRSAVVEGIDLLEIAALHHRALEQTMPQRGPGDRRRKVRAAAEFLAESLSAYEMAYRSFKEKTAALRHINDVLEQEARRIALLLHDEVGQSLFAAELALTDLEGKIEPSLRPDIRKISSVIGQAGEQMRSLSHEMRPTILDDLGLVPALEFLAQGMSKRSRINVDIRSSVRTRLRPALEVILFRVVQEALTNVVRHSNATRAEVALEQVRGMLVCTVIDAGVGFDAAHPPGGGDGLGLDGIRERLGSVGGTLEINSQPGTGTQLIITIPQEV